MKYDVCIIGGCGHVGLPLGIMLADKGQRVMVYDKNESNIQIVESGEMPFEEESAAPILHRVLKNGQLQFSINPVVVSECETAILIIGTPVDEHLNPQFSLMKEIIGDLFPYFYDGQLLVLRSTVFPGMTKRINDWLLESGKKMHVSFCPERILEGKAVEELGSLPQIISSFTQEGVARSKSLFSLLTDEVIALAPMEAELAKLFTNVWRYIKFGVANQFYMIANDYGLDYYRIYDAMTFHYKRNRDLPKPGFAAGPCLFKDTMQLGTFCKSDFTLGYAAMLINEGLPTYVVQKLKEEYDLSTMTVGVLGMAFKSESDDIRESLSYKVKKLFEFEAKKVLCSDPYVNAPKFVEASTLIKESDIIIIATPHKVYQTLDMAGKKVVDIWNIQNKGGLIV